MSEQTRGRPNVQGALTVIASLVAVVSITYSITSSSYGRRLDEVERQVRELRDSRIETVTKLDLLIKSVEKLTDSFEKHEAGSRK